MREQNANAAITIAVVAKTDPNVWQQLEAITEADVPESFRQGMADIAAGRHVDMQRALSEPPLGIRP